jgi:hypothetical protein
VRCLTPQRRMRGGSNDLRKKMGARIAGDRDVLDTLDTGVGDACGSRLNGQTGPVLDPVVSLLFDRHGEVAVDQKSRGRVSVVRIQAENRIVGHLVIYRCFLRNRVRGERRHFVELRVNHDPEPVRLQEMEEKSLFAVHPPAASEVSVNEVERGPHKKG